VSFKLDRRQVIENPVNSAIIELVDVVWHLPFDVLDISPGTLAVGQIGLVETAESLSWNWASSTERPRNDPPFAATL
jgi:hypothetical protein